MFVVTNVDGLVLLALFFARVLARWGHVALPVVLIVIGLLVLFSG